MPDTVSTVQDTRPRERSPRLHYLDWLRVLAVLGVFLFHAVHPFDLYPWEIKNSDQSVIVTLFIVFLAPWGMPLFFVLSGAGSWFALRRRSGRQYVIERVKRLLVPFVVGSIILSPIQLYFQWRQQAQLGRFAESLWHFFRDRGPSLGPKLFGWAGYHLWFLGFLFAFSLIGLPLFQWLDRPSGRRFVKWLGRLSERRGGILVFVLPLVIVQLALRPLFPAEHDWAEFVFMLLLFIWGYILYADERFAHAVRRDWPITLALGIASTLFFFGVGFMELGDEWMTSASTPGFYLLWAVWCVSSWCWSTFMLNIGMRYLDFRNRWLRHGQERIMPFFLVHQPVIIAIAFYVVQWKVNLWVKLPVVVLASLLISLGLAEIMRRLGPLRALFGMKQRS
jgi:peptidoglycan/LPS O-acetylase OafA/YrhL